MELFVFNWLTNGEVAPSEKLYVDPEKLTTTNNVRSDLIWIKKARG
jgi:hypothetical protein